MDLKNFFEQVLLFESNELKRKLNIVTLFSGMGAPEIALDNLGVDYNILLASEYDATAQSIYKKLHQNKLQNMIPDVYDILKHKNNSIIAQVKSAGVDLLIAGFPCQAFSSDGKGYGFNSRRVAPVGKKESFVIHSKYHLKNPNAKPGEKTILKDSEIFPLSKKAKSNVGKEVVITPDSDGILSLKTLEIVKELKPTVVILENVSGFAFAPFENESDILTENYNRGNSSIVKKPGGFVNELKARLTKIGYAFYPLILDPTSYVKGQILRRPRIYMIAIKSDIADKIEVKFDKNINKIFGLDKLYNKNDKEYIDAFNKGIDMLIHSKNSSGSGYMTNDPLTFVHMLITKIGHSDFSKLSTFLLRSVSMRITCGDTRNIETIIEDAYSSNNKFPLFIKPSYLSDIPSILDSKNEDPIKFIEKLVNYIKINGGFSSEITKKIFKDFVPYPEFESDDEWDNTLGAIVEQVEQKKNDLSKNKAAVIEFIIKKYLIQYVAGKKKQYINTIEKSHALPADLKSKGTAHMFIIRSRTGEVKWGYIHPALIARFMGMMGKEDRDAFGSAEDITKVKFNDKIYKTMTDTKPLIKHIIARIGNSMSVSVLEKLFSSLINTGVFDYQPLKKVEQITKDEDEEMMSSDSMFAPTSETGFSADTYAPGDNRLPNSLFKKPLKRKKLKESYYANPEEAFSKGYISAYQLAKIKAEKEGRKLTPEEEMFFANPKNWDNKRPATEEETKEFFDEIYELLGVKRENISK